LNILVLNCGSSSIKFRLYAMEGEQILAGGLIDRIGEEEGPVQNHREGLRLILDRLDQDFQAVGHRVVHGGLRLHDPVLITKDIIAEICCYNELAPLHNPPNLAGIEAVADLLPTVPQAAVFDTSFHQRMPDHASTYAIPRFIREKHNIRKFGFHGISHEYLAHRGSALLGIPLAKARFITCHLGNGTSITAVAGGWSIDTTIGFGTLAGIPMGTRCGDIDPAIIPFLMEKESLTTSDISRILYYESGLLALSETSNDMRSIIKEASAQNPMALLALEVYCYQVKKFIGAFAAALGGLDALIFGAGIGENVPLIREKVCSNLGFLGIHLDADRNGEVVGREGIISSPASRVKIMVIPTNEELLIARETKRLLSVEASGMTV
jgi:acetate kinase